MTCQDCGRALAYSAPHNAKWCPTCRAAQRRQANRRHQQTRRDVVGVSGVDMPAAPIEAVFARALAAARRRYHVDPWQQRGTA